MGKPQKRITLAAVSLLLVNLPLSANAQAYFYDGNELRRACVESRGFCSGFVAGVADHQAFVANVDTQPFFCPPPNVTLGQMVDVVLKHIEDHPELRHELAVSLVTFGLMGAFPC